MGQQLSVLIVEDEFLVALDLEAIVLDAGYAVTGVASNRSAVEALRSTPQIALIDLNLRDGSTGLGIAHHLAARGAAILYVTANPAQIDTPATTAVGVIQKPFSAATIRWALNLAATGSVALPTPPEFLSIERRAAA